MPYVSVIVAAYNSEKTLEECLKSIRGSLYKGYELIVVDNGSRDATLSIAKKYADKVIELHEAPNRTIMRIHGIKASSGHIIVNVDSDIVIKPDTMLRINEYLLSHPEVSAVTGLLSKKSPDSNYFSQYKNLYMHYIFKKLPERVSFLYGSIFGIRREGALAWRPSVKLAEDTAFGQEIVYGGGVIAFLSDLEVTHLKAYNLPSFIINDFKVPFYWAKIFIEHKGWKQLGRNKTGFAHSSKSQLVSVMLAPAIVVSFLAALTGYPSIGPGTILALIWIILNLRFLKFLFVEKGFVFSAVAFPVTLADNMIMASGILCGFMASFWHKPGK